MIKLDIDVDDFSHHQLKLDQSHSMLVEQMTTRIWIEPVKRPDGRNCYTDRGLLLRTRLGGPDGEILCDRVHNAVCETCRVLMSRGIVGAFETWKEDLPYACMRGDIASTAELTVHEPDDGAVHFARWRPFYQDAVSRSAVPSPAREEDAAGGMYSRRHERLSTADQESIPEAAE
jgi:hypothetical protein